MSDYMKAPRTLQKIEADQRKVEFSCFSLLTQIDACCS